MQLKKKKQQKNKTHTHTHTHQKWAKDLNGYFFKERIQIAIVQFSSVQSRPHRWQHTRLRRTWDSPGNTGVGCHSLLQEIFLTHVEPRSPALQADSLSSEPLGKPQNSSKCVQRRVIILLFRQKSCFITSTFNKYYFHW